MRTVKVEVFANESAREILREYVEMYNCVYEDNPTNFLITILEN